MPRYGIRQGAKTALHMGDLCVQCRLNPGVGREMGHIIETDTVIADLFYPATENIKIPFHGFEEFATLLFLPEEKMIGDFGPVYITLCILPEKQTYAVD